MIPRRIVVTSLAVVALAAGSAGAVAATGGDDAKKAEQAVLDDAAKRLDVTSAELRSALSAAQKAQLAQAVEDGDMTREQADRIEQRRERSGSVLGLGGPGHHGHHGRGGGKGAMHQGAARALGLSEAQLRAQLADGKTIAELAEDRDTSVADVKAAMKKATTDRLAADVDAGRLTDAQRDAMLEDLDEHVQRHIDGTERRHGGRDGRGGPRGPDGPPPMGG